MAYAAVGDVRSRAGRLSAAWGSSTIPSNSDISSWCEEIAAEIDAILEGRGLPAPAVGTAAIALRGVNADGALVLALEATFPSEEGPGAVRALLEAARARYTAGIESLAKGHHPAVVMLEAGSNAPSASDFWSDNPSYGQLSAVERAALNRFLQPEFERGMAL